MSSRKTSRSFDRPREVRDSSRQSNPSIDVLRLTYMERTRITYLRAVIGDVSVVAMSPREQRPAISVEQEDRLLAEQNLHPVRYDYPTFDYNCHGWTFLKGRGWLDNTDNVIDRIIRARNFTRIHPMHAQMDDVVLYRNSATGFVPHSGLVGEDISWVDSKWDDGSLFRHEAYEVPERYRGQMEYYHPPQGWDGLTITSIRELSLSR